MKQKTNEDAPLLGRQSKNNASALEERIFWLFLVNQSHRVKFCDLSRSRILLTLSLDIIESLRRAYFLASQARRAS